MVLLDVFKQVEDPRAEKNRRHELKDNLVIAVCAFISGANQWTEVEEFGRAKETWFRGFLALANSIPSHDTCGRVFSRLLPEQFQACIQAWIQSVHQATGGEVVAVDEKTLRRSHDGGSNKATIHMVSAWATANNLVLGQLQTAAKSNEITAIPRLLELLELSGCIVTIDALGCQKAIAEGIRDKGTDYVLALKGNQRTLHADVQLFLETARERLCRVGSWLSRNGGFRAWPC